jgi:hypothetical protein
MPNRLVSNNANYLTFPTLGDTTLKKIYFKAKVYWIHSTGYLFGQAALANREFGMFTNAGALYFIWGGTQQQIGTTAILFPGETAIDGLIEWEYNPAGGAWYFKLNGVTKASGTLVGGTARTAGTLFRIGARDTVSTSGSTTGTFFMPAGSKVYDFELWVDGVKTYASSFPSSGTTVTETVSASNGTLRSPSGADWETYTSPTVYTTKKIVVFGASIENYCYDNNLINPHDLGTQSMYKAGVEGVLVYGYGWQSYTMASLLPKVALMLDAFPDPDTLFICHVAGNDVSATRPYANMTAGERAAHLSDMNAIMAAFGAARSRTYFVGISFREYGNPQITDNIFNNQELGSRPYIDTWWLPAMLSHELNTDGQPKIDYYNYFRNNRKSILSVDGVHPTTSGSPLGVGIIRDFVSNRMKYILDGVNPPIVIPNPRSDLQGSQQNTILTMILPILRRR